MTYPPMPVPTKCAECGNPSWDPWSSWCGDCKAKPRTDKLPPIHQLKDAYTELPSFTAGKVMHKC